MSGCSVSTISTSMHLSFTTRPRKNQTGDKSSFLLSPETRKTPNASSPYSFPVKKNRLEELILPHRSSLVATARPSDEKKREKRYARKKNNTTMAMRERDRQEHNREREARLGGNEAEGLWRRVDWSGNKVAGKTEWGERGKRRSSWTGKTKRGNQNTCRRRYFERFSCFFSRSLS